MIRNPRSLVNIWGLSNDVMYPEKIQRVHSTSSHVDRLPGDRRPASVSTQTPPLLSPRPLAPPLTWLLKFPPVKSPRIAVVLLVVRTTMGSSIPSHPPAPVAVRQLTSVRKLPSRVRRLPSRVRGAPESGVVFWLFHLASRLAWSPKSALCRIYKKQYTGTTRWEKSLKVVVDLGFIGSIIECLICSKSASVGGESIPFWRPLDKTWRFWSSV